MSREEIRANISPLTALVCTLYGEAAGEPPEGQRAVAAVIVNRAKNPRWWGKDIKSVCLKSWQFSCWWEDTPNSARLYRLAEDLLQGRLVSPAVQTLQQIAQEAQAGELADPTNGADHYLTVELYSSGKCPKWAKKSAPVAAIGHHLFFRLELPEQMAQAA